MTPSLEGWPTKAKEAPSPYEVRLAPLDTNPVFQSLGENLQTFAKILLEKYLQHLQHFHGVMEYVSGTMLFFD